MLFICLEAFCLFLGVLVFLILSCIGKLPAEVECSFQVLEGQVGLLKRPPSDCYLSLASVLLFLPCCLFLLLFLTDFIAPQSPFLLWGCGQPKCMAQPLACLSGPPVSSLWGPEFPTSAVVSGLPFRKAKAAAEILSRPVGKCSTAIAINTVPFPLLQRGTPNRKVSAARTT